MPLLIAQRRVEFAAIRHEAARVIGRLNSIDEDAVAALTVTPNLLQYAEVPIREARAAPLSQHDMDRYNIAQKIVTTDSQQTLLATDDRQIAAHMDRVRAFIAGAPEVMQSIEFLSAAIKTYGEIEERARSLMYPSTDEQLETLLHSHKLTPEFGVKLPSFQGSSQACSICFLSNTSNNFVRILKNRCTEHEACRNRASDPTSPSCSCTTSNVTHYECLRTHMRCEFGGENNEGVGRKLARCPSCRGGFCFNDIMCIVVDHTEKPDVETPKSTPQKPVVRSTEKKRKVAVAAE